MKKKFISLLLILIFVSAKVYSLDIIEEMLHEIKQINQKVDLLNEKADNYQKRIETIQEEVRQNFTNIDSRIEMTRDDVRIVKSDLKNEIFDRLNSVQNEWRTIKIWKKIPK